MQMRDAPIHVRKLHDRGPTWVAEYEGERVDLDYLGVAHLRGERLAAALRDKLPGFQVMVLDSTYYRRHA